MIMRNMDVASTYIIVTIVLWCTNYTATELGENKPIN